MPDEETYRALVEAAKELAWWVEDDSSCPEEHEPLQALLKALRACGEEA
jgi:hypothetical protein